MIDYQRRALNKGLPFCCDFSHDKNAEDLHFGETMILRFLTGSTKKPERPAKPVADTTTLCLRHVGIPTPIEVKRSPRSKRYALRVSLARRVVVLTLPMRADLKKAALFAERHADWIHEKLARLPQAVAFAEGAVIPFRGVPHRITAQGRRGARILTRQEADGHAVLDVPGDAAFCARRLRDFLQKQARHDLQQAIARYAQQLDVTIAGLTLRDSKSRWGSCSSTGRLNFSWRLIMAPPFVLDYLAAHEIAHRREMNHSARFWTLLDTLTPHVAEAEQWLKTHGPDLHRFGATNTPLVE